MRKKLVLRSVVLELDFETEGVTPTKGAIPAFSAALGKKAVQSGRGDRAQLAREARMWLKFLLRQP